MASMERANESNPKRNLTTPPAQLRLKDAPHNARRLCPAFWSGLGAIIPGFHARCAFTDHPIRRGDGDGKQVRGKMLSKEKN
jgi:hypothetical protein